MPTREEKIQAIYEEIAEENNPVMIGDVLDYLDNHNTEEIIQEKLNELEIHKRRDWYDYEEIRDIPAVLDGIMEDVYEIKLNTLRTKKRKPLEDQSDECIDFIYSLIQK